MHVHGHESEAVIDHDAISFVIEIACKDYFSGIGGVYRRARRRAKVYTAVDGSELAVKGTTGTVRLRNLSGYRRDEVSSPLGRRKEMREHLMLDLVFEFDSLQAFSIGRDIFLRNCKPRSLVSGRVDRDLSRLMQSPAFGHSSFEIEGKRARLGVVGDAGECEPGITGTLRKGDVMPEPPGGD